MSANKHVTAGLGIVVSGEVVQVVYSIMKALLRRHETQIRKSHMYIGIFNINWVY